MRRNYVVIIPARLSSSRLPGKPLIDILGVPMVVRTYRQVIKVIPQKFVYVATESQQIRAVCESFGVQVLMTSNNCLTGTDRLAECIPQLQHVDTFINVQGDEPVIEPEDIKKILDAAEEYPNDVINGYCAIDNYDQFSSGTVPKVVFRPDGRLLYMSRAGIPSTKTHQFKFAYRQVCCYAFPKKALQEFAAVKNKAQLEEVEDIEILRFLELGHEIRMIPLSSHSIPVDVQEDIKEVEAAIRERGL